MTTQFCPHCGANREQMRDDQPCWRCKRLPTLASPSLVQPIVYTTSRAIPVWLMVVGSVGLLLMIGTVGTLGYLFFTAEDSDPLLEQRESESLPSTTIPIVASPFVTNTPDMPITTPPAAVGPFAETSVAMQSSLTPTFTATIPTPTEAPTMTPTPFVCPDAPQTRLARDVQARVGDGGINMRDNPGLNASVVLRVNQGEDVTIIGEPTCTDGYVWWPVRLASGSEGWMAEGSTNRYYLEPIP
ncbi:MAG: SH3 domain-containing protein [Anaerolineales bacterium]|nr:SH3 domain-containing protein [Anaerolineales bacterium]